MLVYCLFNRPGNISTDQQKCTLSEAVWPLCLPASSWEEWINHLWVWLNFWTSLPPSASRIWMLVTGWEGSRVTEELAWASLAAWSCWEVAGAVVNSGVALERRRMEKDEFTVGGGGVIWNFLKLVTLASIWRMMSFTWRHHSVCMEERGCLCETCEWQRDGGRAGKTNAAERIHCVF